MHEIDRCGAIKAYMYDHSLNVLQLQNVNQFICLLTNNTDTSVRNPVENNAGLSNDTSRLRSAPMIYWTGRRG